MMDVLMFMLGAIAQYMMSRYAAKVAKKLREQAVRPVVIGDLRRLGRTPKKEQES